MSPFLSLSATDTTNNIADLTGDTPNAITDAVIGSLQCENLTVLDCYSGTGTSFGVKDPCDKNLNNSRVKGGCYNFVQSPLVITIPKDYKYFVEWKSRFRLMFGACRGVFSQVFQNNWVNGSLYMFSFKKKTIFNITGQPKSICSVEVKTAISDQVKDQYFMQKAKLMVCITALPHTMGRSL